MADTAATDLASRAISLILWASNALRFKVEVRGLENFTRTPATLVLFNHLRDSDPTIIENALFGGCDLLARKRTVGNYMARDDMFRTGFLARYMPDLPWPARKLLSHLDLRPAFRVLHMYPIRRVTEFSLWEALQDVLAVLGNIPIEKALREDVCKEFEQLAPAGRRSLHVRDVIGDRYRHLLVRTNGFHKLTRECFAAIKPYEEAVIESQLEQFASLLEDGAILQMAPEGTISMGGRFGRIREGLQDLITRTRRPVRVLPVGISYDFLIPGRPRAFVGIGPELTGLSHLTPAELSEQVSRAILAQNTITASHLASELYLLVEADRGALTRQKLMRYVASEAVQWARAGVGVDPRLLEAGALSRQVAEVLRYMVKTGLLTPAGGGQYRLAGRTHPLRHPEVQKTTTMMPGVSIDFIANHLAALREVFEKAQPYKIPT